VRRHYDAQDPLTLLADDEELTQLKFTELPCLEIFQIEVDHSIPPQSQHVLA
jgi:hypothetical protein